MAVHKTLTELFTAIADALRGKTGGTGAITADDFPAVIGSLSTGGITPTGTKTITENGSHDVTNYATALVNVPTPEQISVIRTVTLSADAIGANATIDLLTNDDFIREHYADEGFSALWYRVTPAASETGMVHFNYHGNRNIASSNVARTGIVYISSSATAVGMQGNTTAINGKGYATHMRVASDGSLKQYLASGRNMKAGTYFIVLTCVE